MTASQSLPADPPAHAGPAVPKYTLQPPGRQRLTFRLVLQKAKWGLRLLCEWTRHTVGFFEPMPRPGAALTSSHPAGSISEDMLSVCQSLASDSEARLGKLETKATALLSLIAVVIPLTASAAVFIRQNDIPRIPALATLALNLVAMFAFLLALLAALRAVAVRGHEALFLDAVIDPASDQVRDYRVDFRGRGLLYEATTRTAICDHIADFVRAAQLFLVLGVLFAASAAVPVLFYIRPEPPATIQGTVTIEANSLRAISEALADAASASDAQSARFESDIRALRDAQSEAATKADIERLSRDTEELRRLIQARPSNEPLAR